MNFINYFNINKDTNPFFKNYFVGRKKEIDTLNKYFKKGGGRLATIIGANGTGKTSLAYFFADNAKEFFEGGVYRTQAFRPENIITSVERILPIPIRKRTLLILDAIDLSTKESLRDINFILKNSPLLSMILTSRDPIGTLFYDQISINLRGLNTAEFSDLVNSRLESANPELVSKYFKLVKGNPLLAEIATNLIIEGLLKWDQIFKGLEDFQYSGILGADGKPYDPSLEVPEKIVYDTKNTNDEIISLLKKNPELIRSISPRKFEEIIAEILSRLGYEVELTPTVQDGGFDIYAAKKENVGSFLYLVECKRYNPPAKVGVQVVRSLYGVVQQRNANAGIIVTTSFFTSRAKELQQELKHQMHLQDYLQIQKWLGII